MLRKVITADITEKNLIKDNKPENKKFAQLLQALEEIKKEKQEENKQEVKNDSQD